MRLGGVQLRWAALVAIGALAVHELRVVAGYGGDAELIMREPGHAYLPFATGLAIVLLVVAGAHFARALSRGRPAEHRERRTLLATWLRTSATLVAVYLAQATAESFFDPGHPIVGHGGWSVVPLALVIGGLIALLTREADRALARRPLAGVVSFVTRGATLLDATAPDPVRPRLAPLAGQRAGRAPPLAS